VGRRRHARQETGGEEQHYCQELAKRHCALAVRDDAQLSGRCPSSCPACLSQSYPAHHLRAIVRVARRASREAMPSFPRLCELLHPGCEGVSDTVRACFATGRSSGFPGSWPNAALDAELSPAKCPILAKAGSRGDAASSAPGGVSIQCNKGCD